MAYTRTRVFTRLNFKRTFDSQRERERERERERRIVLLITMVVCLRNKYHLSSTSTTEAIEISFPTNNQIVWTLIDSSRDYGARRIFNWIKLCYWLYIDHFNHIDSLIRLRHFSMEDHQSKIILCFFSDSFSVVV